MNKLDFLSDKQKMILGVIAGVIIIACLSAPSAPGATPAVVQWAHWVKGVVGLLSLLFGLQVFSPKVKP